MKFDFDLDLCGLQCPVPLIRAKKALASMEAGQVLHVLTTDPKSKIDFASYAKQSGNKLLKMSEDAGLFEFFLRRKETPKVEPKPQPKPEQPAKRVLKPVKKPPAPIPIPEFLRPHY
jgi:tRNA 2-thiouridine synthesizing protein A